MKIILCTFLLCITMSVFGQSVELNRIVGQSVKFPAAVKTGGVLMYSGVIIGAVDSSSFTLPRNGNYRGRLQWDSSTGFFSLSGLKMEDSGEYKVQNTDQNTTVFQLNVHTVSVSGEPQELNGILGKSVNFTAAVKKDGSLRYGTLPLGVVTKGSFMALPDKKFNGRVQWDSSTGLFSISGLKMVDIGEYKVHNTDPNITTVFQLNVHKDNVNVSKPHVSITHNEYRCTILCAAVRGTEVTLTLYREGEKKPYVTSPVRSHPHLDMTVPVESGTYTCEARNSVRRETSDPLTVGAHCTAPADSSTIAAIIIAAVVVVILIAVFAVLLHRFIRRRRAVRTLIQVKKLLDNVDLHAYDETDHPDAVRPFILVKKFLYHVDQHAYVPHDAVRHFILVKKILKNVDPHEYDKTVPPDAVRTFIQVKKILDNVDPHVCGETRLELSPDARRTLIQVEEFLNEGLPAYDKKFLNEDLPAYDEEEQ